MKSIWITPVLGVATLLFGSSSAVSEGSGALLTPHQRKAYEACLYAAWIEEYCRANAWPSVSACIVANRGGRFPIDRSISIDSYCWDAAHTAVRW